MRLSPYKLAAVVRQGLVYVYKKIGRGLRLGVMMISFVNVFSHVREGIDDKADL
jgi:hypothetical protein